MMNNPFSVVVRSLGGGARPLASARPLGGCLAGSGASGGGRSVLASRPGSCAPVASASACPPFSVVAWR